MKKNESFKWVKIVVILFLLGMGEGFSAELIFEDPLEESDLMNLPSGLEQRKISRRVVDFVEKEGKKCAYFRKGIKSDGGIAYKLTDFPINEGSFEISLAFDESPGELERQIPVIGFHSSSEKPDINFFSLFIGGTADWGNYLIFILRQEKDMQTSIYWPNLSEWKPKEWHHVGVSWKVGSGRKSEICMYIDHQLFKKSVDKAIEWNREEREATKEDPQLGPLWLAPPWGSNMGFSASQFKLYKGCRDFSVVSE